MSDAEFHDVRFEEIVQAHKEVRDEIQRATGYHISDLDIFLEQGFFYKNIDEEFYDLVVETFSHDMFSANYFEDIHHQDNILQLFDWEEKLRILEVYKNNEIQAHKSIFDTVIDHLI